jgi:hypothetical protein
MHLEVTVPAVTAVGWYLLIGLQVHLHLAHVHQRAGRKLNVEEDVASTVGNGVLN